MAMRPLPAVRQDRRFGNSRTITDSLGLPRLPHYFPWTCIALLSIPFSVSIQAVKFRWSKFTSQFLRSTHTQRVASHFDKYSGYECIAKALNSALPFNVAFTIYVTGFTIVFILNSVNNTTKQCLPFIKKMCGFLFCFQRWKLTTRVINCDCV